MKNKVLLGGSALAMPFILSGAYANTLTRMIPDLYNGLDVVSRELVGMIPSVYRNVSAERAAVDQSIVYPVTEAATLQDTTPAMRFRNRLIKLLVMERLPFPNRRILASVGLVKSSAA